jgi:uncharacterized membrane protein
MLVQAGAEDLYRMWRDLEAVPRWQEEIVRVERTGERTSRWTMRSGEKTVNWESRMLADEPGRRIAWETMGGEVEEAGEVMFEAAPGGRGTFVTVLMEFRVGALASAWETLVGRNPKQAVIENLRHFKAYAETGEIPRSQNDPHGPRGFIGEKKRALYGETIATPPGDSQS